MCMCVHSSVHKCIYACVFLGGYVHVCRYMCICVIIYVVQRSLLTVAFPSPLALYFKAGSLTGLKFTL